MTKHNLQNSDMRIEHVPIDILKAAEYNPRKWNKEAENQLRESITRFGIVDPLLVNSAPERKDIVIGGHFRLSILKEMGFTEVPVVYINIPDIEKEKELNIRLNRNTGEFDWDLLAKFDEGFLSNIGFSSEELDQIFDIGETPEQFDLSKELRKLNITDITARRGEIYEVGDSLRVMIGDSTVEGDMLKLMNGEKASMCMTDAPYSISYVTGKKRHGKPTEGFGYKRDRKYLETDFIPPDFTEKWMENIHKVQKDDFAIMAFECWKNIPLYWEEMSRYWKIRNLIIWNVPNRVQGFAARHQFFNKFDFAALGTSEAYPGLNDDPEEDELLQNEFESALFAVSGRPHWEPYEKGKKYCPTDFVSFHAADEKNSGQGIVFGTKPVEILVPYIKVLTKRGDLVVEPFGGSGSTGVAAFKLARRCYTMEKSPVYAEVIKHRWQKLTGLMAHKIHGK